MRETFFRRACLGGDNNWKLQRNSKTNFTPLPRIASGDSWEWGERARGR